MSSPPLTPCAKCLALGIDIRTKDRDRYLHPERYDQYGKPLTGPTQEHT